MIKLGKTTSSASWIEMASGVRFKLKPLTTSLMMAARKHPLVVEIRDDAAELDDTSLAVPMACAVAELALEDWDGVGDEDGEPVDPSPAYIQQILEQNYPIFEAFQTKYVADGLHIAQEKKGSTRSLNGISAEEQSIASTAMSDATTVPPFQTSREH